MNTILGVVKNGRVEIDAPPDWPEGSLVHVELGVNGSVTLDDEQPETPEEIEERIRRLEAIEPAMTPEEEAAWHAERRACKEIEISNRAAYDKRIEELFP